MNTIQAIYDVVRLHAQKLERISANNSRDYNKEAHLLCDETRHNFELLTQAMPELVQTGFQSRMSDKKVAQTVDTIIKHAQNRYAIDLLSTGETLYDTIDSERTQTICSPAFVEWQRAENGGKNFIIPYNEDQHNLAARIFRRLVMNMLIQLPAGALHLSVVDPGFTGDAQLFTQNLDKSIVGSPIVDVRKLDGFFKDLQDRLLKVMQQCGDLAAYNTEHQTIKYPYEVVLLLDYPNISEYAAERLFPLFENGYKGGIYFVVMQKLDAKTVNGRKLLSDNKAAYYKLSLETGSGIEDHTPIAENEKLTTALFARMNEIAHQVPEKVQATIDYSHLSKEPYAETINSIEVPVGEAADGSVVNMTLNTVDHVHSFIIGQSGSGKSVFLHNFISAAMLKYAPEDLQFYLLDFKMGGVEFNRYRESKHVKALLVDNSDVEITLEILRDLRKQMELRGPMLRDAGVDSIGAYNRVHPEKHMPQIVFVADECHAMFNPDHENRSIYNELSEIVSMVAKEGRSQGVHLVLATQTLAGTEIDNKILANITDHFLLKCDTRDSERMVRDSSQFTSKLKVGEVYYDEGPESTVFQSYFTSPDKVAALIKSISTKANKHESNGQFYFCGSQLFPLDDDTLKLLPVKRRPLASLGCDISLRHDPVCVEFKEDNGENMLFFGINDTYQVTRALMSAMLSVLDTAKRLGRPMKALVIDCLDDESPYTEKLYKMAEEGALSLVRPVERGRTLYSIAAAINDETVEPTLLVILGQERFRQLKNDMPIKVASPTEAAQTPDPSDPFANIFNTPENSANESNDFGSFRKALSFILDNGPLCGVHTLMQIDTPANFLFDDYVSPKQVTSKFNHLVMLRSEGGAASTLRLADKIRLEKLSSKPDRLRAYYYSADSNRYRMYTPYSL